MDKRLIKTLGTIGGAALIFCIIGFTIVHTFLYKLEVNGLYFFTNEYYVEAGGKFLLEMIRSPLLAPHFFLPFLVLLLFWMPYNREKISPTSLSVEQRVRVLGIVILMICIYQVLLNFGKIYTNVVFQKLIQYIGAIVEVKDSSEKSHTLTFFNFCVPIIITTAIFLYRFRDIIKGNYIDKLLYISVFTVTILFTSIVPVAYGLHLYDWKIAPIITSDLFPAPLQHNQNSEFSSSSGVADSAAEQSQPNQSNGLNSPKGLMGRFGKNYLLLETGPSTQCILVRTVAPEDIRNMTFDIKYKSSFREKIMDFDKDKRLLVEKTDDELIDDILGE